MTTADAKAAEFREHLGLGVGPVRDLVQLIASGTRVDVAIMPMPGGLEAMTRRTPDSNAIIVAVTTSDNPERQRFSLAHELGHILFDDFSDDLTTVHSEGPNETRAHDFARHFLAPLPGVQQVFDSMPGADPEALVSALVQWFGVSPTPAAIQLLALGAITEHEKATMTQSAGRLAVRYGWAAEREALVADAQRPMPPQGIVKAATHAYAEGKLSLRVLARLRGVTNISELETELREAGLAPSDADDERPEMDFEAW